MDKLILSDLLDVVTLIERVQFVAVFDQRLFQIGLSRLLRQDRLLQMLRLQLILNLSQRVVSPASLLHDLDCPTRLICKRGGSLVRKRIL